ncbi:MAG: asparagine synthase (glutamine-hydrolyzing), partial [bacterium]
MCGIAGFVHFERNRPADVGVVHRMTDTVRHRGPDGAGYHVSHNVALGHRRLRIIDLVTGDQPMTGADGATVIVFNGEIYNYLELREELQRRQHLFHTSSDTEVILAAYREWGETCVSRFNGMWAFALWDAREQKLFCSRDRLGEKPFYYAVLDRTFVFGSEAKALFAYGVPRDPNPAVLGAYLCLTYVPGTDTFFRCLQRLAPGYNLTVQDGRVRVAQYWDVCYAREHEARRDEGRIVAEFRDLLRDAVRVRMRSDVPFGAFLSGGLDSATVVAFMAGLSSAPVKTCTIGFQDRRFDETAAAAHVAARYATDHWVRTATVEDVGDCASRVAWHFDEPFGDSSAVPTYLVARAGRERVTMVLTGDGGDEVLSGYTIHQGEKLSAYYRWLPRIVGSGAIPWLLKG